MTFKVGDKVKVVNNPFSNSIVEREMGRVGIIKEIVSYHSSQLRTEYYIKDMASYFFENELALINPQLTFVFHD